MRTMLFCLMFFASGFVASADLDAALLDHLTTSQQYDRLLAELDNPSVDNAEALTWFRDHADEWHPPLLFFFSDRLFKQAIKMPSKALVEEQARIYARAKAAFYIDQKDCNAVTQKLKIWNEGVSLMSLPVEMAMQPYPHAVLAIREEAFSWATRLSSSRGGVLPPPATWLCGDENILQDSERGPARLRGFQELAQQILALRSKESATNSRLAR
ncbi:MAG: hypothetical protein ACREX0_16785 [Noviherbaspirillum sp.]